MQPKDTDQKNNIHLTYGSCVYLYHFSSINDQGLRTDALGRPSVRDIVTNGISANKSKEYNLKGFLESEGFLNNNINFLRVPRDISNFNKPDSVIPNISNLRSCVFRIVPKLKFEFHKVYHNALKEYSRIKDKFSKKKVCSTLLRQNNDDYKTAEDLREFILSKEEEKVLNQRLKYIKECEQNLQLIKLKTGEIITYGSEVMFQHIDSDYFISSKMECAMNDKIGYRVELTDKVSQNMVFTILSKYRSRNTGDLIQHSDFLYFKNNMNGYYLSISMENSAENLNMKTHSVIEELDSIKTIKEQNPQLPEKNFCDPCCSKNQVYLGQEPEFSWQILLHSNDTKIKKEICGQNLVTINHVEQEGDLSADISYKDNSPNLNVFFKKTGREDQETKNFLNIKECEKVKMDVSKLWQIEFIKNKIPGSTVLQQAKSCQTDVRQTQSPTKYSLSKKFSQSAQDEEIGAVIRLRHFLSGRLLGINLQDDDPNHENNIILHTLSSSSTIESQFTNLWITPIQKKCSTLLSGSTYMISTEDNKSISYNDSIKFDRNTYLKDNKVLKNLQEKGKYKPLNSEYLNEEKICAIKFDEISKEDAYKITKIDTDFLHQIFFVKSGVPILYKFAQKVKNPANKNLIQNDLKFQLEIKNILNQLMCFLFEFEYNSDFEYCNVDNIYNPCRFRQSLQVDFNVIDLIFDIVHYPFINNIYNIKNLNDEFYIRDIVKNCYYNLISSMKNNHDCEIYCAQWLSQLFEYSTMGVWGLGIRETLKTMLSNNETILDKQVDDKMIQIYISYLLENGLDPKFAQILSKTCICNEEPILKNQRLITEIIFRDSNVKKQLILKLKEENGEIMVKDPQFVQDDEKFIRLIDFEKGVIPGANENFQFEHFNTTDAFEKFNSFDYIRAYEYFLSCTILMGDICNGRNIKAQKDLQIIYPFDILLTIIRDNIFGFKLRKAACYLLQRVWVDVEPFREHSYPTYIKFWDNFDENHLGMTNWLHETEFKNLKAYGELKLYIYEYLQQISDQKNPVWANGKDFLQVILDLTEKMLQLRFFYKVEAFAKIFESQIKVLKITDSYVNKNKDTSSSMLVYVFDYDKIQNYLENKKKKNLPNKEPNSLEQTSYNESHEEWIIDKDILKLKHKIMKILNLQILVQNDLKSSLFFSNYKSLITNVQAEEGEDVLQNQNLTCNQLNKKIGQSSKKFEVELHEFFVKANQKVGMECLDRNKSKITSYAENTCKSINYSLMKQLNVNFNYCLFNSEVDYIEFSQNQFSLLVEQMKYKDDFYKKQVTGVIYSMYTQGSQIGNTLTRIQMVESKKQRECYERVYDVLSRLYSLSESIDDDYYYRPYASLKEIKGVIMQVYHILSSDYVSSNYKDMIGLLNSIPEETRRMIKNESYIPIFIDTNFKKISIDAQHFMRNANGLKCLLVTLRKMISLNTDFCLQSKFIDKPVIDEALIFSDKHSNTFNRVSTELNQIPGNMINVLTPTKGQDSLLKTNEYQNLDYVEGTSENKQFIKNNCITNLYLILARCCINNQQNQDWITEYDDHTMFAQLFAAQDFSQSIFTQELLNDNKTFILDAQLVSNIIFRTFKRIEGEAGCPYKQSFQMTTLLKFVFYKTHCIKANQNILITAQVSDVVKKQMNSIYDINIRLLDNIKKHMELEKPIVMTCTSKTVECINGYLNCDQAYLEIATYCAYGRNSFTEKICHTLFSLDECLTLMADETLHPVLHLEIIKFFYHVFVDTDLIYSSLSVEIMKVMPNLQTSLEYYLQKLFHAVREQEFSIKRYYCTHKELVLQEDLLKEIIEVLISCIKTYIERVIMSSNKKSIKKVLRIEVIDKVEDILRKGIKGIRNDKFRAQLENLIIFISNQVNLGNLQTSYIENDSVNVSMNQSTGKNDQIDMPVCTFNNLIKHKVKLAEDLVLENSDMQNCKGTQFEDLINKYLQKDQYKEIIADSFEVIRHQNYEIPWLASVNPNELRTSKSYKTLVDSLAYYLDPDHTKDVPNKIYQMALKIWQLELRVLVSHHDNEVDAINIKESKQIRLIENGIVKIICYLLLQSNDDEIYYEALLLACLILDGGNFEGQQQFHRNLDEMCKKGVLKRIESKLQSTFMSISKLMNFKNKNSLEIIQNPTNSALLDNPEENYWTSQDGSDINLSKNILLKILEFLQLLCEGHNLELQKFLNKQFDDDENAYYSVNFISTCTTLYGSFIKIYNLQSLEIGNKILAFLNESIQGPCRQNQNDLNTYKIYDYTRDFMHDIDYKDQLFIRGFRTEEDTNKLDHIYSENIKLLMAMLEGTSIDNQKIRCGKISDSPKIIMLMEKKLIDAFQNYIKEELDILKDGISLTRFMNRKNLSQEITDLNSNKNPKDSYTDYIINPDIFLSIDVVKLATKIKVPTFSENIMNGFNVYFYYNFLQEYVSDHDNGIVNRSDRGELHEAVWTHTKKFYEYNTGSIEVNFNFGEVTDEDDNPDSLQKYYFPIHPACRYLPEQSKKVILHGIKTDNPQQKVTEILNGSHKIMDLMNHIFDLEVNQGIKYILPTQLRYLLLLVTSILNGLYLTYNRISVENNEKKMVWDNSTAESMQLVFGVIHIILAFLIVFVQMYVRTRVIWNDQSYPLLKNWVGTLEPISDKYNDEDQQVLAQCKRAPRTLHLKEWVQIIKHYDKKVLNHDFSLPYLYIMTIRTKQLIKDDDLLVCFLMLVASIIGFSYSEAKEFIYSLFLLDVIPRSQTQKNVVQAVTRNRKQLLLTLLLCIIIMWIQTVFAYYYLQDSFWNDSFGESGENQCTSMLQCLQTIVSLGPRSSGGIGDMLTRESFSENNRSTYYLRFFYDVFSFAIVNLIFLNIIFGIIIDTFAELRDEKRMFEEDRKGKCAICSLDKTVFDKQINGFEYHTKNSHNVWNYYYFLYYLKNKEETEYTGLESYVHKCLIPPEKIDWMPIAKSIVTQNNEGDTDEDVDDQLEKVLDTLKKIIEDSKKNPS